MAVKILSLFLDKNVNFISLERHFLLFIPSLLHKVRPGRKCLRIIMQFVQVFFPNFAVFTQPPIIDNLTI